MKIYKLIFPTLFLLISLQAFAEDSPVNLKKIKIGVSTPLTGESATYGLDIQDFLKFANEKLGQGRYELIFEDDKCSGKDAVASASKLINIDKVQYMLGFACSGATLAAAPLYERAKIPTIISYASSPQIRDAGDYVFRTYPSDSQSGKQLFTYVQSKHASVAILSEQTEYAQDLKSVFIESNGDERLKIVVEDYLPSTTDFRTLLTKLKAQNPEALFINTQTEQAFAVILDQLGQLKWSPALYGAYWPASPSLLKLAKEKLNGIVFIDTPSLNDILNPEGQTLYNEYKQGGGTIRTTEAVFATSLESFRALDQAIQSGSQVKDFLYQTQFNGVFGSYRFDDHGEIQGLSLVIKRIENGEPKRIPG